MSAELEIMQGNLFTNFVTAREDGMGAIVDPEIPYDEWAKSVQACGQAWGGLGKQREAIQFILCDLYLAGEKQFPTQFEQMLDKDVIDTKMLTRILWVGKKILPEQRHAALCFSIHEISAGMEDPLQREEFLAQVEKEELTVADATKLRKEKFPTKRDSKPKKKASPKAQDAPAIDLTDEHSILTATQFILSYLQLEEEKLPFREWPANRLKAWQPFLSTITKIARRSIIQTH